MQADFWCERCLAAVRRARTLEGQSVLLDPPAEINGNVWIDHFELGQPIVALASSPEHVPRGEPLRYRLHVCLDQR